MIFGKDKLKIVVHHHVFSAKTAEVFGDDAVDLTGVHILHHSLETRSFKISPAPTVVDVLKGIGKAVFLCVILQYGTLRFNADAVPIGLIIAA